MKQIEVVAAVIRLEDKVVQALALVLAFGLKCLVLGVLWTLLGWSEAGAQTKIYHADGNYQGSMRYVVDGDRIYYADGNYRGKLAFVQDENRLYYAEGNYRGKLAVVQEGDKIYHADGNYRGRLYMVLDGPNAYFADGNYRGRLAYPGPPSIRVAVLALVKASRKSVDRGCPTQIRNPSPQMPSSKPDAVPLPYPLKTKTQQTQPC